MTEILASAPGRMVMAFTEHTLNYVLLCIIEHIAKPCRVLNNWFQSFFPSPCRLKSQWPLAPLSSSSTPPLPLSPSTLAPGLGCHLFPPCGSPPQQGHSLPQALAEPPPGASRPQPLEASQHPASLLWLTLFPLSGRPSSLT